jgi:lysophospholipase L1-like esterase
MSVRALLVALAVEVLAFGVFGIVIVDLRLHSRFERVAGVNVEGYRGPLLPRRRRDERRLLLVGDSTAFGYGVAWTESFGFYLRNRLDVERNRVRPDSVVTMINAATISDGAHAVPYAVRDFRFVAPDVVVVDAGYDALCDGCAENRRVSRHQSALFVHFGYMPMLPQSLREKGAVLAHDPSPVRRAIGRLSGSVSRAAAAIDRPSHGGEAPGSVRDVGCPPQWTAFCGAIHDAVADALSFARAVVVVTPPYLSERHREQQRAMAAMLQREFAGDNRVLYLDEGSAVDLHDPAMSFDGVHLTARGNQRLAESLVPPLRTLLDRW